MAGGAGGLNGVGIAEGCVVGVEAGDVVDLEARVVEDALAARDAGLRSVGAVVPGGKEGEYILIERPALGISAEGIVDAGIVVDTCECGGPSCGAAGGK
jgi:hypothetical protein